jgi:hypothetical protein
MNTKSLPINYRAVIVTGIIAFILSLIWYSPFVFGKIWMELRHAPIQSAPSWTMIFAPLRELIASYVVALLITSLAITDWKKSVKLTFLLVWQAQSSGIICPGNWDWCMLETG